MVDRGKVPLSKARLRSAISNGRHVLNDVDHRGPQMRRLKDLIHGHTSDLGGEGGISQGERTLIGRACMLTLLAEMKEATFAKQDFSVSNASIDSYARLINALRRTLGTLGLKRRPRDVTPTIQEYIASKRSTGEDFEPDTEADE